MTRNPRVEALAKKKMKRAQTLTEWDDLRDQAAMKQYYRDQARIELGLPRNPDWERANPR